MTATPRASTLVCILLLSAFSRPAWSSDIKKLSVEQKVGQLFMIAIDTVVAHAYREEIAQGKLGGGLLRWDKFTDEQAREFTGAIQKMAPIPFLFAADHEGGPNFTQRRKGWTIFPGNMALGATGATDLAEKAALASAKELRSMGVGMTFGPVLDVNSNPHNPIIGLRSFGEDPDAVTRLGTAAVKGYKAGGALAVIKHFPGHGDTDVDSHTGLPRITRSIDELKKKEFLPFKAAVDAGAPAVMPAHIIFTELDPKKPVTLSPKGVDGLLREKMGFKGLVVTDSMDMKGATAIYGKSPDTAIQACMDAFGAGCDVFLLGKPERGEYLRYHQAFVDAVKKGKISEDRLDLSVERILKAKQSLVPPVEGAPVPLDKHSALAQEIAEKAVTLLSNDGGLLPLKLEDDKTLLVLVNRTARLSNEAGDLVKAIKEQHEKTESLQILPGLTEPALGKAADEAVEKAKKADVLIVGTYSTGSRQDPGQAKIMASLQELGKPIITVSLMNPYDAQWYDKCPAAICSYGMTPASMQATARLIFGQITPQGKLPVTVSKRFPLGSGLSSFDK